jgi:hypothetical protein
MKVDGGFSRTLVGCHGLEIFQGPWRSSATVSGYRKFSLNGFLPLDQVRGIIFCAAEVILHSDCTFEVIVKRWRSITID